MRVQPHAVVGLAQSVPARAVVDLQRVAPEALQDFALALVEQLRRHGLPGLGLRVYTVLQLGRKQAGDEVTVAGGSRYATSSTTASSAS